MHWIKHAIKQWGLLVILLLLVTLVFYFRLDDYLSFNALALYRMDLIAWRDAHFPLALLLFGLLYILVTAISIPGAWFLTLVAGFLFGIPVASILVICSATLGACIAYLAVKLALRDWIMAKNIRWLKQIETGFKQNAFSYLLFLRFVPLFPFWLVNIAPALFGISSATFFITTLIGIIPGSIVYVAVGNGLGHILDMGHIPNLQTLKQPILLLPLIGFGLLALLPILYRYFKR